MLRLVNQRAMAAHALQFVCRQQPFRLQSSLKDLVKNIKSKSQPPLTAGRPAPASFTKRVQQQQLSKESSTNAAGDTLRTSGQPMGGGMSSKWASKLSQSGPSSFSSSSSSSSIAASKPPAGAVRNAAAVAARGKKVMPQGKTLGVTVPPISAAKPLSGFSSTLRDSFRKTEHKNQEAMRSSSNNNNNINNSYGNHNTNSSNSFSGSGRFNHGSNNSSNNAKVQSIRRDVLNTLTDRRSGAGGEGTYNSAGGIQDVDAHDVTPGDIRYRQQQQRMQHKRRYMENEMNYSKDSSGATAAAAVSSNGMTVIDIAEMKRRTELSMRRFSESSSSAGDLRKKQAEISGKNNYKISKSGRRVRINSSAPATVVREVTIPHDGVSLRELASKLSMRVTDLEERLRDLGELGEEDVSSRALDGKTKLRGRHRKSRKLASASPADIDTSSSLTSGPASASSVLEDKVIDADVIELLVLELGLIAKRLENKRDGDISKPSMLHSDGSSLDLLPRAPVVSVMGHVDHGKTTLMDALRNFGVNSTVPPSSSSSCSSPSTSGDAGALLKTSKASKAARAKKESNKSKKTKKSKLPKAGPTSVDDWDGEEDFDNEDDDYFDEDMAAVDSSSSSSSISKSIGGVAGTEAGGITQKLSAFTVQLASTAATATAGANAGDGEEYVDANTNLPTTKSVVFVDTPGHAAFSGMRKNSALATDLVVLVVAVDDGVQPQTIDALKAARGAGCTIIVALNKIDKIYEPVERENARRRVLTQLLEYDLIAEEFGGDTQVVELSAKTGEGVEGLVEALALQSDLLDLKAVREGPAEAAILEAKIERGRGAVVDLLVRWGSLRVGDAIVAGTAFGRVKSMMNSAGELVQEAFPSQSVRVQGLRSLPGAGQHELLSVSSEARARQIVDRRERVAALRRANEQEVAVAAAAAAVAAREQAVTEEGGVAPVPEVKPTLHLLLKTDGTGPLDALQFMVNDLANRTNDIEVKIVGAGVGDVTLADIERASTVGDAIVLCFNVNMADTATRAAAKENEVEVYRETIVYRLEEELIRLMEAKMPKERTLHREGTAKVQKVFSIRDKQKSVVAGLVVQSGRLLNRGADRSQYIFKFTRPSSNPGSEPKVTLEESVPGGSELKRFKDIVHEVESGTECGLSINAFTDVQEGDEVECLRMEWRTKPLIIRAQEVVKPGQQLQ